MRNRLNSFQNLISKFVEARWKVVNFKNNALEPGGCLIEFALLIDFLIHNFILISLMYNQLIAKAMLQPMVKFDF